MRFPIDDAAMTYTCATGPQPVKDYGNGGKATEELISIKVVGKLSAGTRPGAALKVVGPVAAHWAIEGKSGMAFRASKVEPASTAVRAAS